jgi:hypothetical protein
MLLAVDLDDKLRGVTVEVGDISIEGNLPLELRAMEARAAQPRPKNLLRARHMLSEGAGELVTLRLHGVWSPHPCPSPFGRGEKAHRLRPLIFPAFLGRASPPPQLCGPMSASVGLRGRVDGRLAARPKGRSPA